MIKMKKILPKKKMAEGGNISELSDAELNRLGYAAQAGNSMRGLAKTQLEERRRRRAFDQEETKRNASEDQATRELEESLGRGENASLFMNEVVRSGGGMKKHKAQEYKKGGMVKPHYGSTEDVIGYGKTSALAKVDYAQKMKSIGLKPKGMAAGGMTRGDGVAQRGKTKGRMI